MFPTVRRGASCHHPAVFIFKASDSWASMIHGEAFSANHRLCFRDTTSYCQPDGPCMSMYQEKQLDFLRNRFRHETPAYSFWSLNVRNKQLSFLESSEATVCRDFQQCVDSDRWILIRVWNLWSWRKKERKEGPHANNLKRDACFFKWSGEAVGW